MEELPSLTDASRDPITSQPSRVTSSGASAIAPQSILFGDSFHGAVLDEDGRWTQNAGTSGDASVADGQLLLATGATGGFITLTSKPKFALYSGAELLFTAIVRLASAPISGSVRNIGLQGVGVNDQLYFNITDTAWQVKITTGPGTVIPWNIGSPRADALAWMKLQIRATKSRAQFIINDSPIYLYNSIGEQEPLHHVSLCTAFLESSDGTSAGDNWMYVSEVSVVRSFESWPATVMRKRITADGIIARGPCWYLGMKKGSGTGTCFIHDDVTAGASTKIDEWTGVDFDKQPTGPIECQTGIYADVSSTEPVYIDYALA